VFIAFACFVVMGFLGVVFFGVPDDAPEMPPEEEIDPSLEEFLVALALIPGGAEPRLT
jgi:hypothetical protein